MDVISMMILIMQYYLLDIKMIKDGKLKIHGEFHGEKVDMPGLNQVILVGYVKWQYIPYRIKIKDMINIQPVKWKEYALLHEIHNTQSPLPHTGSLYNFSLIIYHNISTNFINYPFHHPKPSSISSITNHPSIHLSIHLITKYQFVSFIFPHKISKSFSIHYII
jgi:hypothetical protein